MFFEPCFSIDPVGGKASLGKKSKGDSSMADRMSYSSWMLKRLVHLLDAPGIPQSKLESVGDLVPIFWMWHFIMSTYPEVCVLVQTTIMLCFLFLIHVIRYDFSTLSIAFIFDISYNLCFNTWKCHIIIQQVKCQRWHYK